MSWERKDEKVQKRDKSPQVYSEDEIYKARRKGLFFGLGLFMVICLILMLLRQ